MGDVERVFAKSEDSSAQDRSRDTVVATLEFANGANRHPGRQRLRFYPGYSRRLELSGSEGTIILEQDRIIAADLHAPIADLIGLWMGAAIYHRRRQSYLTFQVTKKSWKTFYTPSRPIPSLCATVAKAGAASNWCRQFMIIHAPAASDTRRQRKVFRVPTLVGPFSSNKNPD